MFNPKQIEVKLLIEEVPYLSMIEMQDDDWDDLGRILNLQVQGAGPRAALRRDELAELLHPRVQVKDYWSSVKAEVFTLLCTTDEKYEELRKRLSKHSDTATLYVLSTISVSLSAKLGASLAMITPLVGTVLYAIAKLGITGWCRHERTRLKRSTSRS